MKKLKTSWKKHFFLLSVIAIASCQKDATDKTPVIPGPPTTGEIIASDPGMRLNVMAFYAFDGNTGDSSSRGNHIIFNNATPTADRYGKPNGAYLFNGTDNYMRVANHETLNPRKGITLFAIVKVNGFYKGECHGNTIFSKSLTSTDRGSYYLGFSDSYHNTDPCHSAVKEKYGSFAAAYGNGQDSSVHAIDTIDNVKAGKWYFLAFTQDSAKTQFYVNGELKYEKTDSTTFLPNNHDLFIGANNIENKQFPNWFNGVIDEIAIFKVALTKEQLQRLSKQE